MSGPARIVLGVAAFVILDLAGVGVVGYQKGH